VDATVIQVVHQTIPVELHHIRPPIWYRRCPIWCRSSYLYIRPPIWYRKCPMWYKTPYLLYQMFCLQVWCLVCTLKSCSNDHGISIHLAGQMSENATIRIYISDLRYDIGGVLFDIGAPIYISDLW